MGEGGSRFGRTVAAAALLGAFALVAAACGGGDDGSGGSDSSTPEGAAVDASLCPLDALESADGPVDVELWYSFTTETEQSLLDLVEQYNASQDQVRVIAEKPGSTFDELQRAYNQGIQSGQLPAVANLEEDETQFLADSGTVVPASACIAAGGEEPDWLPAVEAYYSIEDVLWPGAFSVSTPVLYYNRGHFEDAGIDPDAPPQTLDEVRAAAEAIQDAGVTEQPLVLILQPWFFESWITGAGQPIVDEDNGRDGLATESTIDEERALEVFTWVKDMYDDGLLQAISPTEGQIDQYLAVARENGSMLVETSTAATSVEAFLRGELDPSQISDDDRVNTDGLEDLDLSLDIDVAQLPGLDEAGRAQITGGAYYVMSDQEPEVIAGAWDFIEFMNTLPAQTQMNLDGSYLPTLEGAEQSPELASVWESTLSGQWLATAYDQLLTGVDPELPGPVMGPYTDFRDIMRSEVEGMLTGDRDPAEVLADIQSQLDEALAAYEEQNF
jgi:sn-glycerol 3-phosphate transport system substrate-binding protein